MNEMIPVKLDSKTVDLLRQRAFELSAKTGRRVTYRELASSAVSVAFVHDEELEQTVRSGDYR